MNKKILILSNDKIFIDNDKISTDNNDTINIIEGLAKKIKDDKRLEMQQKKRYMF